MGKEEIRQVWQEMAPTWERQRSFVAEASKSLTKWMIEKLDAAPGEVILDLAGGPGDLGFAVAEAIGPQGKLISSDFASEMVEVARRRAAELGIQNVEFKVIDAENNALTSASVDGVLCRWGYMLMLQPALALAETRRVTRPGGRLVFAVMGDPEANPWATVAVKALKDLGLAEPGAPTAPAGLFSLADEDLVRQMVLGAGFADVTAELIDFHFPFSDFDDYWGFLTKFAGAVAQMILPLTDEQQTQARKEIEKRVEQYKKGEGYDIPGVSISVVAT